jgi:6-phosphofructokinase 1
MIVVAEGIGDSVALAQRIESTTGLSTRATILGHLQRGGNPTALDRMWASVMGFKAVETYLEGHKNRVIVVKSGACVHMDIDEALSYKRPYDDSSYKMMKVLAL